MRPGTAEVDVEGVAISFGGEFGGGGGGYEVSEGAGFASELAVGVGVFVDGSLGGGVSGGVRVWWGEERTFSVMVLIGWCFRGVSVVAFRRKRWRRLGRGYMVVGSLLLMFTNR